MKLAFTLLELIIVIGIIGVLASIVMVAIAPTKQLNDGKNAQRNNDTVQIENAVNQYIVDLNTITGIPQGKGSAKDICLDTLTGTGCTIGAGGMDLSALTPVYAAVMPVDPDETSETVTGYRLYQIGTMIRVCAPRFEAGCGS